jgi:2-oxoglutarate dehydrogenase E2 component (dihydrolipoamide succinyltransferase)
MPIELKVPSVGESVTEVYIGEWHKSPGDRVDQDEDLVEVESEKATFDIPAPAAGVLGEILKQTGDTAQVGDVIGYIEDGEAAAKESGKKEKRKKKKKGKEKDEPEAKSTKEKAGREAEDEKARAKPAEATDREEQEVPEVETRPRVMPAARREVQEPVLPAEETEATGAGEPMPAEGVLRHVETREVTKPSPRPVRATPVGDRAEEVVSMSPIRRRIAHRLLEAQRTAALLTTFNEIDMSTVQALRKQHQETFRRRYGIKLGFMSFFVKAAVDALKRFPKLNAEVRESDIVYKNYFDVSVAVSTETGLMVPVIRNAERLSFAGIEQTIDDFARRARDGKLGVDELTGGTFTITNGGIFGSLLSTPIVNPPQSGVLGMHAIQDRPVVRDGEIVVRPMMYVALTYDHRIVDGREAVSFLQRIKDVVEEPSRMLFEA